MLMFLITRYILDASCYQISADVTVVVVYERSVE